MSKTALARAVGVNMTTISRWEDEENPSPPTLDKAVQVAAALGVPLGQLAYGREPFVERVVEEALRRLEQRQKQGGPS